MKLTIPEGYTVPAETEEGQNFEELVTFRLEGDSLVPVMIAGVEIPMESDDEEDDMEEEATAEMEAGTSPMTGMGERIMGMA